MAKVEDDGEMIRILLLDEQDGMMDKTLDSGSAKGSVADTEDIVFRPYDRHQWSRYGSAQGCARLCEDA